MNLLDIISGVNWGWALGIIIIFAALWLIVKVLSDKNPNNRNNSSLDILKQRYAKGLISKSEFEEKSRAIL